MALKLEMKCLHTPHLNYAALQMCWFWIHSPLLLGNKPPSKWVADSDGQRIKIRVFVWSDELCGWVCFHPHWQWVPCFPLFPRAKRLCEIMPRCRIFWYEMCTYASTDEDIAPFIVLEYFIFACIANFIQICCILSNMHSTIYGKSFPTVTAPPASLIWKQLRLFVLPLLSSLRASLPPPLSS